MWFISSIDVIFARNSSKSDQLIAIELILRQFVVGTHAADKIGIAPSWKLTTGKFCVGCTSTHT